MNSLPAVIEIAVVLELACDREPGSIPHLEGTKVAHDEKTLAGIEQRPEGKSKLDARDDTDPAKMHCHRADVKHLKIFKVTPSVESGSFLGGDGNRRIKHDFRNDELVRTGRFDIHEECRFRERRPFAAIQRAGLQADDARRESYWRPARDARAFKARADEHVRAPQIVV